jgi:outer membrane receptor protein involved in Fe transport
VLACFTWDNIDIQQIGNYGALPFSGSISPVSQWVHRLAAVLHATRNISVYVLDSTSFIPPPGSLLLQNGQKPPNQSGKGDELGLKWNFLGGKVSGEAAWFHQATTNGLNDSAGSFPNGLVYGAVIGGVTEEGVDGDTAFLLAPGWQVIGSWYAGHQVDPLGNPVPNSNDNSWSFFSRYDFQKSNPLSGFGIGGGITRVGGRWMNNAGLDYTKGPLPAFIKLYTGTVINAFVDYRLGKHWSFKINCANLLNDAFVFGNDVAYISDPSPPRTFSFQTNYKF